MLGFVFALSLHQIVFCCSELGTVPLEGDVKQEAIILMQSKRIDVLKKKLEDVEKEKAISLTTGVFNTLCYE